MTLKDRQRQAAYDTGRSSFTPPVLSISRAKLDLALMKAERDRQQRQRIEAMEQDMRLTLLDRPLIYPEAERFNAHDVADLIEHAKRGEFKEDDASR